MVKLLSMITGKVKLYGLAFVGALISIMAVAIRYLTHRNSKLRDRAEYAEAYVHRAKVIADRDNELEAQARSHRAEVKREIDETGGSTDFRNPNSLWDDTDD